MRTKSQLNSLLPLITQESPIAISPDSSAPQARHADDSTGNAIAPSSAPPRHYTQHPSIDEDAKFRPTCHIQPARSSANAIIRKPTLTRKSSKREARRSLALHPNMGVLNEAVIRSAHRQPSNPVRVSSPTLSEAEDDLHEQLSSFKTEQSSSDEKEGAKDTQAIVVEYQQPDRDEVVARMAKNKVANNTNSYQYLIGPHVLEGVITPPPEVPRKSSKRQSSAKPRTFCRSQLPSDHISSQIIRGRSRIRSTGLTIAIPDYRRMTEEFFMSPMGYVPKEVKRAITPSAAEKVILSILQSLDHLEDLFATAVVNWGFYRVFKRHELDLIKSTLHKMSPPAWEFREIAYPGHDLLHAEDLEMTRPEEEYTATTYLQLQKQDIQVVRAVKYQIMEKCHSFVRPEISTALSNGSPAESARVDNALWRIWTFCKIFGSGKGREEDIVAQMDWLKGGVLVHQKACTFSIMTTDFMNDTLIGAPECFAKGNEGGLTAEELFDMMELWNCLGVLLQGFEGRTAQARKAGIYESTDIRGGDIDGEETMLGMILEHDYQTVLTDSDEWCYHLLTYGLSTVLDLAGPCRETDYSAFATAVEKGWVDWKPPVFGGTRRNFLKEAASRVYEDKIAQTYAKTSTREVQRHQSKMRLQKHMTDLRNRKNTGEQRPLVRMSQERPMSEWDTVIGNLTRRRSSQASRNDLVSYIPTLRSALAHELTASVAELPATRSPSPMRRTTAQPLLPTPPPSTVPSNRYSIATSMPSIEEHPAFRRQEQIPEIPSLAGHPAFRNGGFPLHAPQQLHARHNSEQSVYSQDSNSSRPRTGELPAFQQHEAQHDIYSSESHENTADKAIYRIVEMGFTPEQAREALRMTDLGDGLRVDRAVELLLSRQM